jgi:hypothetical protein
VVAHVGSVRIPARDGRFSFLIHHSRFHGPLNHDLKRGETSFGEAVARSCDPNVPHQLPRTPFDQVTTNVSEGAATHWDYLRISGHAGLPDSPPLMRLDKLTQLPFRGRTNSDLIAIRNFSPGVPLAEIHPRL